MSLSADLWSQKFYWGYFSFVFSHVYIFGLSNSFTCFQKVSGMSIALKSCDTFLLCRQEITISQIQPQSNIVIGKIDKLTLLWRINAQISMNYRKSLRLISIASLYSDGRKKERQTLVTETLGFKSHLCSVFCDLGKVLFFFFNFS